ncbi:hypothetical protein HDU81_009536 [Chytriomyces hyalinus]|nr:hypothetical protein HDU81_009536 [Chytriomyces hyalinus]
MSLYMHTRSLPLDRTLPLSGETIGSETLEPGLENAFIKSHHVARSSFVALMGHGDTFKSIDEMVDSLRPGLSLEASSIPKFTDQSQALERDNKINAPDDVRMGNLYRALYEVQMSFGAKFVKVFA